MKIGLVANGVVREIFQTQPVLHPDLMANVRDDLPDNTEVGMILDESGNFVWPEPTTADINIAIDAQIRILESKQDRALREIACDEGDIEDSEGLTPKKRIKALDTEIKALRAQRI